MEQLLDQIRTWRRHLHAIPEIGFQEYKTSKYLYEELEKMKMTKEKKTLIMRYGLYGREPMTQKEVAKELHISRSYVSRIEKKAIRMLKSKIKI